MENTTLSAIDDASISLSCGICYDDFNVNTKRPHVLECGHSLCYDCLKAILSKQRVNERTCPFDKRALSNNINDHPVNWSFLEMITIILQRKQPKAIGKDNAVKIKLPDGVYEGEIVRNNIREGKGRMTYKNGSVYEGEFKNNLRKGNGKLTYKNQNIYEGNWNNDLPNGQGILTYKSGEIKSYNGNWKDGKFFGVGNMLYENDINIEGIYVNNELFSADMFKQITKDSMIIGKYQNNNNKIIEGYEIDFNGYVAKGNFVQESIASLYRQGDFIITYNNGDIYHLNYKAGVCDNFGEINYLNGDYYKGDLKLMKKDGYGVMIYKNNGSYEGEFKNDLIDGKGVFNYEDGGCYNGEWSQALRHGSGKYKKNKYSFGGQWEFNEKNGIGVERMENGDSYSGYYKNNVKEGEGVYIFNNLDSYKGMWKDNEMHGQGALIYNNGKEVYGVWSKGKLQTGTDKDGRKCSIY